ncbi:MAG: VWA domain-containing protein [Candidatus Methanoperedens sp.]|nr:VWA domain-containing protein [Candidatus Methanoperedens sp.]
MDHRPFTSYIVIALILVSIFSPAATASIVYGPVKFERTNGAPATVQDNFSLSRINGNYTLYIQNGDEENNQSSSSLIRLNGETVVRTNEFNQNIRLIEKNISVQEKNELEIQVRSSPGSHTTLWIEDETPLITILSPSDDTASNQPIIVSGTIAEPAVTSITLTHNGAAFTVPVIDQNFSTIVHLVEINNITISAIDSIGRTRSITLLLDGDMLPEYYERLLGFDPQNPDSDSSLTQENEAGNGIKDGYEMLGGQLPSFVKYRIGADPFKEDTDGDGLTDYFELMKLGLLTDIRSVDSDSNGIPDAEEDPDNDGLTNLKEQTLGTDPLVSDTDKDSLPDGFEVSIGTNPLLKDTDNDGLDDDSELRLGTDPLNPDTDGDGILDGDEAYTSVKTHDTLDVRVSITGKGDLARNLKIYNVASGYLNNVSALVSPVVDLSLNRSFESASISLPYNPDKVSDPANLSLFYFNETLGTFIQIESTVDPDNRTVTGTTSHFSVFAIFYVPAWNALFEAEMNTGRGGTDVVFVDVMFTIDSSGSMSWNDPYGYRKIAAKNFVGALIPGDRAGVVDFDSYAYLIRPLTDDFSAVNASIDSFDAWGGTNIGAGVSVANSHLISAGNTSHAWMMILLTDGEGYYHDYYTQQAVANNITIYTIGLGSSVDSTLLTGIATATGGQYYSVASADQLPEVFRTISGGIEPADTDGDGIPDALETGGFRDGLGNWYFTDPNDPDTDGDGLSDGEEAGVLVEVNGKRYFNIISKPTLVDSDYDGIADSDEEEFGTSPLNPDYDKDGLKDGFELEIGTDPLIADTDYDGFDDYEEYLDPDYDPLVYEKRYSYLEIGREIVLGAVLGEWGADDHDSLYYFAGWMLSGFIVVGDIRDIAASIWHGDGLGTLLNALALIPAYGDTAKVSGAITKFVAKHPNMVFSAASFTLKYVDDSIIWVKASIGDDIVKNLNTKGFSDDVIVSLYKQGIDLKRFDDILTNSKIYQEFPGLPTFVRDELTSGGSILTDRVTIDVKKMTAADAAGKSVAGYLGNLKGAYGEYLVKKEILGNIPENSRNILIDTKHVNKGGPDYSDIYDNVLNIAEAKTRQTLTLWDLRNYIKKDELTDALEFNVKYSANHIGKDYFDSNKNPNLRKQFILYLNGPNSQAIKDGLNLPSRLPYNYKTRTEEFSGTIDIVVRAVNK